ncbi:von Willebrand factor type A domain-containing protein [Hymenobacter sp. BT186]|uniref:von Willebrand factor type A domain-containing protein n=1 Tax=Hymenobacter telluris TaxID=2816474 RepID=A0A939EYZ3_9BACT|nr:VWA domain-containing protein [Hymenobacter telluris]MBO0359676.1 von Willebrand factor type A domain-containing protein [Hymenobacter telluris]MBW3375703.1 von Willebrand factor type A domain-containing protein [Hymenobacter norwichensis]
MKNFLLLPLLVAAGSLAVGAATTSSPAKLAATFRLAPTPDTLTVRGRITDRTTGQGLPGVTVLVKGTTTGVSTAPDGGYRLVMPTGHRVLIISSVGYVTQEHTISKEYRVLNVALQPDSRTLNEVVVTDGLAGKAAGVQITGRGEARDAAAPARKSKVSGWSGNDYVAAPRPAPGVGETYAHTQEGGFRSATKDPLSTFSIDVDAASYSNVRRFLNQGQLPPPDAVRIEEMLNYFQYDYPQPTGPEPFSVTTELAACPWNPTHQLVNVGLQGKTVATDKLPPANLVFLVDVSGSMMGDDRLPLVQAGLRLLVKELRPQDKVALVVYAGAAGLVLPPTAGNKRSEIMRAIDNLRAGGSTAGGAGLRLAYQVARDNFQKDGNNRVILATDGDFNVGEQSDDAIEHLIVQERESGVFLTVLGVGQGNYQDKKMELLADKGNGNYAYLDNLDEARRVLVRQFGGTLFTLAKDVKLQVEFNPARVREYRLIGYENRTLAAEDFNNDRKDAGEMGAGHTVTALYEVVPVGAPAAIDKLKYQQNPAETPAPASADLMTVKLRYKEPQDKTSKLFERTLRGSAVSLERASENLRFAAAVAQFGMLLRASEYRGDATWAATAKLAEEARGKDPEGYRAELVRLMKAAEGLQPPAGTYGSR